MPGGQTPHRVLMSHLDRVDTLHGVDYPDLLLLKTLEGSGNPDPVPGGQTSEPVRVEMC